MTTDIAKAGKVMEKIDKKITELYNALETSKFTVAITGAGISISAGGVSFSDMLPNMGDALMSRNPEKMYESLYRTFLKDGFEHGPTVAHKALAKFDRVADLNIREDADTVFGDLMKLYE